MKLVIITDSTVSYDSHKVTGDSELTTFHVSQLEEQLPKYLPDLLKVEKVVIVGRESEFAMNALFLLAGDESEVVGDMLKEMGFGDEKLPPLDVVLTQKLPDVQNGDILVSTLIGGHFAVIRVNYMPEYDVKNPSGMFGAIGLGLTEECHVTYGDQKALFVPIRTNGVQVGYLNFKDGTRPEVVGSLRATAKAWAGLCSHELFQQRDQGGDFTKVCNALDGGSEPFTSLVGAWMALYELDRDPHDFDEANNLKRFSKLIMDKPTDIIDEERYNEYRMLFNKYVGDKVPEGNESDINYLHNLAIAYVAKMASMKYPYHMSYHNGLRAGAIEDMQTIFQLRQEV